MSRPAKALHGELTSLGFVLVRSKRHPIYRHHLGGPILPVAGTGSDCRGAKNALAKARSIARELEASR